MFYAARKEQKNKRTFAYSGEYLKGKKAFQNRNTNVEFTILRKLYSQK